MELYCRYTQGAFKVGKGPQEIMARDTKAIANGVTRVELGKLLEKFKIYSLSSLGSQLDLLKAKRKKDEAKIVWISSIQNAEKDTHSRNFMYIRWIFVCAICGKDHNIHILPYLPCLKVVYI